MSEDEKIKINNFTKSIQDKSLKIYDRGRIGINEIRTICRNEKLKNGLDIVYVDYLQLVNAYDMKKNYGTREQEVSTISGVLKEIAMELNVPVVALSQLNRGVEAREDKRPKLADLRESGGIEQDADVVGFLYRPGLYKQDIPNDYTELILAKQRNDNIGTAYFSFSGEYSKFKDGEKEEF